MEERTYTAQDGRWVTAIGEPERTEYGGLPCNLRLFRGDYTLAGDVLHVEERADGTTLVWYQPPSLQAREVGG